MMIKREKAYTLIEVILAVFIFSIVALPLLGIYLQSVKTDVAARNVLSSNYIAQRYLEKMSTQTYTQLLTATQSPTAEPVEQKINNYY